MKSRHVLAVLTLATLVGGCDRASAVAERPGHDRSRVTRLDIISRRPAFGGTSFENVGPYEVLIGKANAVIDPTAPHNTGIVDLDKAPRNADGLVEYSVDVQILRPVDITKGNGVMFYEVNNRGNRLVYTYFSERDAGYESSDIGNGILMTHGYTAVRSGWLSGSSAGRSAAGLAMVFGELPIATSNGQPIVGMAREEWIRDTARTLSGRLSYRAATLDQRKATLTFRRNEADPRQPLTAAHWSYVDDKTVKITEPPGTDAGTIYEFIYPATDPIVTGLGFAAVRDVVSFLRYSAADDAGHPNPLFVDGKPVLKVAVSTGTSQSGGM